MPIQPNQLAEKSYVQDDSNPLPATGPGKGTWGTGLFLGITEGVFKDSDGTVIQMTENGEPKANSNAGIGPVGPAGPQGGVGGAGPTGSSLLAASGVPSDGLGADGDIYVNVSGGDFYEKVAGTWGSPIGNISGGPAGPQGATGPGFLSGSGVPAGGLGSDGDSYVDTDNGDVYLKTTGTWNVTAAGALQGPTGPAGADGATTVDDGSYVSGTWLADTTQAPSRRALAEKIDAMDGDIRPLASTGEAQAGTANDKSMSPLRVKEAIAALETGQPNAALASEAEAQTGTDNAKTMTALRVAQAITAQAGDLVSGSNLSDVANAVTALSNLGGLAKANVVAQLEAETGTATVARAWTAERVKQAITAQAGGGGDMFNANDLGNLNDPAAALANIGGLAASDIVSQVDAEAGSATDARVWTAERVGQAIAAQETGEANAALSSEAEAQAGTENTKTMTALRVAQAIAALAGAPGALLAANDLSDVNDAATSLGNIGGLAESNVVSQVDAEAGTATDARVWTAERVAQAIAALGGGGGSPNEFKIFLNNAATLALRISNGSTTLPAGWTIQKGDDVSGEPFTLDADTLIVTHNLAANTIAVAVRVFEHTGGPAAVANINQVMPDISSVGTAIDTFKNNSGGTKFQIKAIQTATTTTKDLTIYIKMFTL